jgi:hypothetical protein
MSQFISYFDGSGSPDDTVAVVVGGFVAPAEQWAEFERNWNECLRDFGVSGLHMRDFAHSRGEFSAWKGDEERRRRFLARLISIIQTRVRHSFASAVRMEDYRKVDAKYCLREFSKPYTLAGCTCIASLSRWWGKWRKPDDSIALVFEDGDLDKGDLARVVGEHFIANLTFLPKKQCLQFQAADLLAYEHLKVNAQLGEREPGVLSEDELRYPLRRLSEIPGGRSGVDWGVHMGDDMTESCIRQRIPLRQSS